MEPTLAIAIGALIILIIIVFFYFLFWTGPGLRHILAEIIHWLAFWR